MGCLLISSFTRPTTLYLVSSMKALLVESCHACSLPDWCTWTGISPCHTPSQLIRHGLCTCLVKANLSGGRFECWLAFCSFGTHFQGHTVSAVNAMSLGIASPLNSGEMKGMLALPQVWLEIKPSHGCCCYALFSSEEVILKVFMQKSGFRAIQFSYRGT